MSATQTAPALALLILSLIVPASAMAGQSGGSIRYEDRAAVEQELEFRAYVWHVPDDYYRADVGYRQVGADRWKDLDQNWCWYRRCALKEMIAQARYLARDGYIWRFEAPTPPPVKAATYAFGEACYRDSIGGCADRLLTR